MKLIIIGDIVSSKKISERSSAQRKLKQAFRKLNSASSNIISPYTLTLGDEFQAVYKSSEKVFHDIIFILMKLHPVKIRFSLGVGEITTSINRKQALGMDGPGFYLARDGMEELKKMDYKINLKTKNSDDILLHKKSLFLLSHMMEGWRKSRLELLTYLYEGFDINKISKKIKISDKAVYKNIDAGALDLYLEITGIIEEKINSLLKQK